MGKEINEYKPIRILTLDGSDIYRAMHVNGENRGLTIKNKRGKLDTTKFRGFLDSSLDTIELHKVFIKHREELPWNFIMCGEYTASVVNVSFDYSVKEFYNRGKNFFVKDGYDVRRDELTDHVLLAEENGEKTVIAIETIGKNKVTVPTQFYKIIYDLTPPQKMIGFLLPNKKSDKPLRVFAVSVDEIERLTGLDFFSEVPQQKQNKMEKTCSPTAWHGL